MNAYQQVEVTIHMAKGEHFFFACLDDLKPDLSQYTAASTVTDFCTEIPTLKPSYQRADNTLITVKPLDCAIDTTGWSSSAAAALTSSCVDYPVATADKPVVFVNS